MGPPIFIGGDGSLECRVCERVKMASMGPPIFIGGDMASLILSAILESASMGPPIFIGGDTR